MTTPMRTPMRDGVNPMRTPIGATPMRTPIDATPMLTPLEDEHESYDYAYSLQGKNGTYLVSRKHLGGGANASVWEGIRKEDGLLVAVKKLDNGAVYGENLEKTVMQEIAVLEQLSKFPQCNPRIVCIYDWINTAFNPDESHPGVYIMLELLSGGTLESSFDIRNTKFYLLELTRGLHLLHMNGIIHRDIKPSNIVLSEDGVTPKICDLGSFCREDSKKRSCKRLDGTFAYMDPIISNGGVPATSKSDMFSLGVTMYSLITEYIPSYFGNNKLESYNEILSEGLPQVDELTSQIILNLIHPTDATVRPSTFDILHSYAVGRYEKAPEEMKIPESPALDIIGLILAEASKSGVMAGSLETRIEAVKSSIETVRKNLGDIFLPSTIVFQVLKRWEKEQLVRRLDFGH